MNFLCHYSLSGHCWSNSILELWGFDKDSIDQLKTNEDVVKKIRETKNSPVYQMEFQPKEWLGELTYDDNGDLVKAKAAKMLYVIKATSTDDMNNRIVVSTQGSALNVR